VTEAAGNFAKFVGYRLRSWEISGLLESDFALHAIRVFCCRFAVESASAANRLNRGVCSAGLADPYIPAFAGMTKR